MRYLILLMLFFLFTLPGHAKELFVEAESFENKGGWVVDQQFMDCMGSPYLLAHGMGIPVKDASKVVVFPRKGKYSVYVRTYNWTSPWKKGKGAGQFKLDVDGKELTTIAGCVGDKWLWQKLGEININKSKVVLSLHDITGFDGRCDAIYFTTDGNTPPTSLSELEQLRKKAIGKQQIENKKFDFVVVGGGIAGMCAAMSAARQGMMVALINDRPIWGGCNSSDIRVHLGGRIELTPYNNIGNMIKEFGPLKFGNARPAENYMDSKKDEWLKSDKNISLFPNMHVISVKKDGESIKTVVARNIETGLYMEYEAPLFSDCTGDGTLGYLAGAQYMMGREAKSLYNEERAPVEADSMTLGCSVQWYSKKSVKSVFPEFSFGIIFNEENMQKVTMGEWTWETGMNKNQINDAEYLRDYGLIVIYSNWSYLKNHSSCKKEYEDRCLDWVAYVAGKRESRRIIGDYVLNANDIVDRKVYDDGTASTSWSIDLHSPDPSNSRFFPGNEFISQAIHTIIYPYPVPYRCLYSKNVCNLFMAGRNISVTHIALGTTRVMRTTGMLGEVVGLAASVCKKYNQNPRDVYNYHIDDLKNLMKKGAGKEGLPNNQLYNEGNMLMK